MAFPILLALAAIQAGSAAKQAGEIRDSADLTQSLNEINAKYYDYDAHQAEIFGQTEAASYDKKVTSTIGAQRVGYAAGNVDVNYGTAKDLQNETKLIGNLNILDITNEARSRAQGIRQNAWNLRYSGKMANEQAHINANATETAGYINAGETGYRGYSQMTGENPKYTGGSNKTSTKV